MNAGLPVWFDLESWFPAIFKVRDACGYTPYIAFKISMAEILLVIAGLTLIVTIMMTLASILESKKN